MTAQLEPDLVELIEATMREYHVPGAAVGLSAPDYDAQATFGLASLSDGAPVDVNTSFEVASITKTVVATLLTRLVEEQRLSFDVPIRTYLPDLQLADETVAARVTLRHVVTHTAGWLGDDRDEFGADDDALARYVTDFRNRVQVTPLGAMYSYNNSAFCLGARVIEVVTGKTFEQSIDELVIQPLGLATARFPEGSPFGRRVSAGHFVIADGTVIPAERGRYTRAHNANGGLLMSIRDLMTYALFHLGDGRGLDGIRVLSPEALELMHTPQSPGPEPESMGIAWRIRELAGARVSSHAGDGTGQQSLLTLIRQRGVAVATLTNSSRGRFVAEAVANWTLRRYLGATDARPIALDDPGDRLNAVVGRWTVPGRTVELRRRDRKLTLTYSSLTRPGRNNPPTPEMTATLTTTGRLLVLDGALKDHVGEFFFDPVANVDRMRFLGRVHTRDTVELSPKAG